MVLGWAFRVGERYARQNFPTVVIYARRISFYVPWNGHENEGICREITDSFVVGVKLSQTVGEQASTGKGDEKSKTHIDICQFPDKLDIVFENGIFDPAGVITVQMNDGKK